MGRLYSVGERVAIVNGGSVLDGLTAVVKDAVYNCIVPERSLYVCQVLYISGCEQVLNLNGRQLTDQLVM